MHVNGSGTESSKEDSERMGATRPSTQRNQFVHTSCTRCGTINGHGKGQCPASGAQCLKFLKMGHCRKRCKAKGAGRKDAAVVMGPVTAAAS